MRTIIAFLTSTTIISGGFADTITNHAGATMIRPLTAVVIQDLDFGTIAPSTTSNSTVSVRRGVDNSSICGSALTCLTSGNRSRVTVTGEPFYYVRPTDPGAITISNANGDTMSVHSFVGGGSGNDSTWGGNMRLSGAGSVTFNIGATIDIAANQPPGAYSGTFITNLAYE